MTEKRTGAQIMCEALIREGVEVMFGIPGGAIMPFYHAMWEYRDHSNGEELSRRLKAAGFRFVGPTTVYSSMEACGIVNGHRDDCWVRDAVEVERRAVV